MAVDERQMGRKFSSLVTFSLSSLVPFSVQTSRTEIFFKQTVLVLPLTGPILLIVAVLREKINWTREDGRNVVTPVSLQKYPAKLFSYLFCREILRILLLLFRIRNICSRLLFQRHHHLQCSTLFVFISAFVDFPTVRFLPTIDGDAFSSRGKYN